MTVAEIVSIGDEITSGAILDTNGQWLSQQLGLLGISVSQHTSIADLQPAMMDCFRQAASRSDLVIVTGGLGPTSDDLTRQALCEAFGSTLEFDQGSWDHIVKIFETRNRIATENNRIQAKFPAGSEIVPNSAGTAPGIRWTVKSQHDSECEFWCFPGVPSEMKKMWKQTALPAIAKKLGSKRKVLAKHTIKTFGAGESEVEERLGDLIRRGNDPLVGITASLSTISLRIQATGSSQEECEKKIQPVAKNIRTALGNLVFTEQEEELEDVVLKSLAAKKKSIAVTELGTEGLLGKGLAFHCKKMNEPEIFTGSTVSGSLPGFVRSLRTQQPLPENTTILLNSCAQKELQLEQDQLTMIQLESTFQPNEDQQFTDRQLAGKQDTGSEWSELKRQQKASLLFAAADKVRQQFGSDIGLATGPLFQPENHDLSDRFWMAISYGGKISASEEGETIPPETLELVSFFTFQRGGRDIQIIRAAKQALNHLRLKFLA